MKINNLNNPNYQKAINKSLNFTSGIKKPENYTEISPGLIATGGVIDHPDKLRFLVNNGYRSVISFLDPTVEDSELYLRKENSILESYNEENPSNKIQTSHINIFNDGTFRRKVLDHEYNDPIVTSKTRELDKMINSLPAPIYGHCLCGDHCSSLVADVVRREIKQGKIIT